MGLHNLIEAMSEVTKRHPDVLLLIAGKGALKEKLDSYICSNNLAANVRLLGAVSDKFSLYFIEPQIFYCPDDGI
jgi:glycogen(starch) synthase